MPATAASSGSVRVPVTGSMPVPPVPIWPVGESTVPGARGPGREAPVGAAEGRPVDAAREALAQLHLDDLGFDHHLPLDDELRHAQVRLGAADLGRQGADGDDARLRIDDDAPAGVAADDRAQRLAQLAPEIAVALGRTWLLGGPIAVAPGVVVLADDSVVAPPLELPLLALVIEPDVTRMSVEPWRLPPGS